MCVFEVLLSAVGFVFPNYARSRVTFGNKTVDITSFVLAPFWFPELRVVVAVLPDFEQVANRMSTGYVSCFFCSSCSAFARLPGAEREGEEELRRWCLYVCAH